MKNFWSVIVLTLLAVGMVQSIKAQQTFDSKKKGKASVNTSSLGALRINGASRKNTGARGSVQSTMLKKDLSFPNAPQKDPRKVFYSPETGLPSFITSTRDRSFARSGVIRDVTKATTAYLDELKPILQLEKIRTEFVVRNVKTDRLNKTHVRLNQQYKGLPVYGAEVIVHLNEFNEGEAFNGNYLRLTDDIDPVPMVSKQSAVGRVSAHLNGRSRHRELSSLEKKLVQYEKPEATLCIYQDKGLVKTNVLAYHIVSCPALTERWEYFVDATTGAILYFFESTCPVDGPKTATGNDLNGISHTINTYQKGTTYYMLDISRPMYIAATSVLPDEPIGGILTIDMNNTFGDDQVVKHATSTNNTWTTATQVRALSAHFNAGVAYEYFRTNHGRNSIDGEGGTIISIVNVPDKDGSGLDNAYWNGKAMFYGNGATSFKPLAGSVDVAGHEMTHGVVQSTANLEYQGESGAINESIADIFGSMMDPADWLIGEDVVKPGVFPGGALRSLQDPHNGGTGFSSPGYQPRHKNEAYTGPEDNGGVHINSGIPNHAFYKYAEAITREKAADVFYKALDDYLTKSSKFIDLRLAVIKAAGDLFGTSSNEVAQAELAFDFVGITNGEGGDYAENLPDNPGAEYFLIYNTNSVADSNTLYRVKVDGDDDFRNNEVLPLTTSKFNSRPSVTDKGDAAVFVASNNTIHVITTSPGEDPEENVLQDQQIWSNVVISKGGTKIAAVTNDHDARIYVYDFGTAEWGEFELYNPTYTEGVNSAGPVYADALEFDYSGEFLVYDCFNRITNQDGADIEYWDVNFIHVWDNKAGGFSDGTIEKLFPSLPVGVSIGNPSFAKNSPYIIAFDYVDERTNQYAILGCNIEKNKVNVIVENETLGFPSYDKNDTRIAFTTMLDDDTGYQTSYIKLTADKISSTDSEVPMYRNTKWPVYFAAGKREIGDTVITSIPEEVSAEFTCYPNPFTRDVTLQFNEPMITESRVVVINTLGQRVFEYKIESAGTSPVVINLDVLQAGYYVLKVSNSNRVGSCKLVKY